MNKGELVTTYEELQKKYDLPSFEIIDKEFFLSFAIAGWYDIPGNIPVYIMNRMMDYYNNWINFCHSLINGNPQSMILMREAEFFSDEDKKELIKVMTELTILSRKQTVINLKNEEKETVEFIKEIHNSWNKIKPTLLKFSEQSYAKWVEETKEPKI